MGKDNIIDFTAIIFRVNGLLDDGKTADMEEILSIVQNKKTIDYLIDVHNDSLLKIYSEKYFKEFKGIEEDKDRILTTLSDIAKTSDLRDLRRHYGIENNGLLIITAFCAEAIQQIVSATNNNNEN